MVYLFVSLNTFSFFFRASVSSQEPGLVDQWHGPLLAVDASQWYRGQEGRHIQHPVPALRWKWRRQWCDSVWAMRARTAVHPTSAWSDWYLCGNFRLRNAHKLHVPRRGHERRSRAEFSRTLAGERHRQHTTSWWVAQILLSIVCFAFLNSDCGNDYKQIQCLSRKYLTDLQHIEMVSYLG